MRGTFVHPNSLTFSRQHTPSCPSRCPQYVHQRAHKRPRCTKLCAEAPQGPPPAPTPAIPSSFTASCSEAIQASQAAIEGHVSYQFIEFDTTAGDPTYSLLKNTIPVARALAEADWDKYGGIKVVMPDVGSAAMVKKDWGEVGRVVSTEKDVNEEGVCALVAPGAQEVGMMQRLAEKTRSLIVLNPDLVDMGITGLSLNARKLRVGVVDRFQTVFCLRTYGWGLLLRKWPGSWTVWKNDESSESGFALVKLLQARPTDSDIDDILKVAGDSSETIGILTRIRRFLSVYMKG